MSDYKKPKLVGTGIQKGFLKTPVSVSDNKAERLGMSKAFWGGFRDGYIKTFVFGVSFGLGFVSGLFFGEMM